MSGCVVPVVMVSVMMVSVMAGATSMVVDSLLMTCRAAQHRRPAEGLLQGVPHHVRVQQRPAEGAGTHVHHQLVVGGDVVCISQKRNKKEGGVDQLGWTHTEEP
jgi:hypothetical protein